MGLESTTYLSGLNSSFPASGDAISQGDDHIKLVKSTLLASFPSVDQAVQCIHVKATAPSTSVASGMLWFDTDTDTLKLRNEANDAWISLPISPATSWKIMGSATVGWTLPTDDGTASQVLQTNGSGALSFASIPTRQVNKISYFAGDASASVRSTTMTTGFSFTVAKAEASTDLLLQVEALTGLWNYGTSQTGDCQIYSDTGSAALGASVRCTGEWNNLGASSSSNNEVRGITSITRHDTTGLAVGNHIFNVQFTCGDASNGGNSIGQYNAVAWELT